jgi:hypothetical protein
MALALYTRNWRIYKDDAAEPVVAYANENTTATLGSNLEKLRIRTVIKCNSENTISKMQYSLDHINWTDMGVGNHWNYADGKATEGDTTTTYLLTGSDVHGKYIESATNNVISGSGTFTEVDYTIVPTANVTLSTLYYFACYAYECGGALQPDGISYSYSSATSADNFDPLVVAPTITTGVASSIAITSATLGGNITNTGGENNTVRGFQYGLDTGYGSDVHEDGSYGTGAYTLGISSLLPDTEYHFRAYSTNSVGTTYGDDVSFITSYGYTSQLRDIFNDSVLDTTKWDTYIDIGCSIVETNTGLELTVGNTSNIQAYIDGNSYYDLTDTAVSIEVIDSGVATSVSYQFYPLMLYIENANRIQWMIYKGVIAAVAWVNGVQLNAPDNLYHITYDATAKLSHKYLRIRESGGIVYWDYSANGISWTNAVSETVANLMPVTHFEVLTWLKVSAVDLGDTATVSNFNVLPSATPLFIPELV